MPQVPENPPAGADKVFGENLRRVREENGLTQQELAERMKHAGRRIDNTAVARIERGQRSVYLGEAIEFAQILGVSLHNLTTLPGPQLSDEELRAFAARAALRYQLQKAHERLTDANAAIVAEQQRINELTDELAAVERRITGQGEQE